MNLSDSEKQDDNNKPYVDLFDFIDNKEVKMLASSEALNFLRNPILNDNEELKFDFYFYTDSIEKAKLLASELKKLGYTVKFYALKENESLYSITGKTTKVSIDEEIFKEWVEQMCNLGYKCDCEFDGWGIPM